MPRAPAPAIHGIVRYEPVLRLVRELGGGDLLEVGSAHMGITGHGLTEPGWRVTVLDRSFDNYGQAAAGSAPQASRLVTGDARELPFPDRSFDVTVALDLMEHVPPDDRKLVLRELGRVTGRRAIVGCPTGPAALEADRRLAESFRARGKTEPEWLTEHLQHGLPSADELRAGLAPFGRVRLLGNENADSHERLMRLHTRLGWFPPVRMAVAALAGLMRARPRLAARPVWLLRGRDRDPVYRTIAVVDVEPA